MYPSSNIPTLQDIQKQYRDAAGRARGRDVASPFAAATGEMARGRTMELEALNRQQIQAQQQQQAMARDTGIEMLGGNMAGEQRFQQAVAEGGQRYNQAASQLGIQQAQAEQARDARADAMDLQATGAGMQFSMQDAQQRFQQQEAQFNRQARIEEARLAREHATESQKRQFRVQVALRQAEMREQRRQFNIQTRAAMRVAQMRYPQYGGGGGGTASYSSGAGNFKDHLVNMGAMHRRYA